MPYFEGAKESPTVRSLCAALGVKTGRIAPTASVLLGEATPAGSSSLLLYLDTVAASREEALQRIELDGVNPPPVLLLSPEGDEIRIERLDFTPQGISIDESIICDDLEHLIEGVGEMLGERLLL